MEGEENHRNVVKMDVGGLVRVLQNEMMNQYHRTDPSGSGMYVAEGIGKTIEYINTACGTKYETNPRKIHEYHNSVIMSDDLRNE